jgi:TolA-binding protein
LAAAGNEAALRLDIKALRAVGAREITCLNEAPAVADFLEKQRALERESFLRQGKVVDAKRVVNGVDLVICDEQAGGLAATAVLREMFARPELRTQPYLILSSTAAGAARLRAAGLHVLERPYSPDGLCDALRKAMSPLRRLPQPEDFLSPAASRTGAQASPGLVRNGPERTVPGETFRSGATTRPGVARNGPAGSARNADAPSRSPEKRRQAAMRKHVDAPTTTELFNRGLGRLKVGDADGAEQGFLEVLRRQKEHVGAALGMARISRARGNGESTRKWLVRAAAAARRGKDDERVEHIKDMLPYGIRNSIFLHEAVGHMLDGDYREAVHSFLDAAKAAEDMPLHGIVARGCLLTGHPEENMSRVCDALSRLGRKDEALNLRRRLLDYTPRDAAYDDRPPRFPVLAEALRAASFAVWAWKQA